MSWLIGIFQSILAALRVITDKKVAENKKIGNDILIFLSRSFHLIIVFILIFLGIFSFGINSTNLNFKNFLILIVSTSLIYLIFFLRKVAYSNEKVSVLQPFAMLAQVFPIIFGFIFIASERENVITFLVSLFASLVVILTSIDYKNFKINKYSLMVLAVSILKSLQIFAVVYLLNYFSPTDFYILESIVMVSFAFILLSYKKDFKQIKNFNSGYSKLFIGANLIVISAILLNLVMFKSLGIILTSLIGLLYLVFVYMFSYFILHEKIAKKDIIVSVIVAICIIVGIFFKH